MRIDDRYNAMMAWCYSFCVGSRFILIDLATDQDVSGAAGDSGGKS